MIESKQDCSEKEIKLVKYIKADKKTEIHINDLPATIALAKKLGWTKAKG